MILPPDHFAQDRLSPHGSDGGAAHTKPPKCGPRIPFSDFASWREECLYYETNPNENGCKTFDGNGLCKNSDVVIMQNEPKCAPARPSGLIRLDPA